jgi:hypothetical protein
LSKEEIEKYIWLNSDKNLRDIRAGIKEIFGISMSLNRISKIRKAYLSADQPETHTTDQPEETRERRSAALKEVRSVEITALSNEAEKIATFAIGIGGVIARRYLGFLDYEISHGKTLEFIAEEVMQWYEMKHSTLAEMDELKTELEKKREEVSAAWAKNLPNLKYWLRTRIFERYATQVINARIMGVRLPVSRLAKVMQTDLLELEDDVNELFDGEIPVGIES